MGDVHVVFGAGSLGSTVAEAARDRGHTVKLVSRSGSRTLDGIETVKADASDPEATRVVCEGAAVVYNCAVPPYPEWPTLFGPLQNGIVEGAAAAGSLLVVAENVYVYGKVDGPMTEETPWNPCSRKGELKAKLNQELLDADKAGKVRVALGRGPDYYGPRAVETTVYGERVFYPALAGKAAQIFGDPDAVHTWTNVGDFARGLVTLGENQARGVWHIPAPQPLTQRELLDKIFEVAGHKTKIQAMPGFMTHVLGVFIPIMRELAEMQYQWQSTYDFRWDKYRKAYGGEVTPHDVAVRETVGWYRANPKK